MSSAPHSARHRSPAETAVLALQGVTVTYEGERAVLEDITLDVQPGEIVGLTSLDLSGGKSTLLKAAAGLLPPQQGEVRFAGEQVYGMSYAADQRFRRRCALVFEGGALLVNRTVYYNVALPLRYHRHVPRAQLQSTVERLLEQCGYNEDIHAFPSQVSARGQRMAAFARALAREPELVLVDRFFEGLEMPDWKRLFELVMELNHHRGVSWVLVSECDPTIFRVAERVAVLDQGRLRGYGFRRELFADAGIRQAFQEADEQARPARPDSERFVLAGAGAGPAGEGESPADDLGFDLSGGLGEELGADPEATIVLDGYVPRVRGTGDGSAAPEMITIPGGGDLKPPGESSAAPALEAPSGLAADGEGEPAGGERPPGAEEG